MSEHITVRDLVCYRLRRASVERRGRARREAAAKAMLLAAAAMTLVWFGAWVQRMAG